MTLSFFEHPANTREEILAAAYNAIYTHGYADLTIQKIGQEFDKSSSLLYHYYSDKDELLLECLEFMLERYGEHLAETDIEDARVAIDELFDTYLDPKPDRSQQQFTTVLVELRAQAAHSAEYREHFTRSDRFFESKLADAIEFGVEQGTFRERPPEPTATLLYTFLIGTMMRSVTGTDTEWQPAARTELDAVLEATLYRSEET